MLNPQEIRARLARLVDKPLTHETLAAVLLDGKALRRQQAGEMAYCGVRPLVTSRETGTTTANVWMAGAASVPVVCREERGELILLEVVEGPAFDGRAVPDAEEPHDL